MSEPIVLGSSSGMSSAISDGISPMNASTSSIICGMTLPMMAGAILGNRTGIIFAMSAGPPGSCAMARIIGPMPAGMASTMAPNNGTMNSAMALRSIRRMNLSKYPHI